MSRRANISREMERLVAQLKSTEEQIKSLQEQMDEEEIDPSLLEPVVSIKVQCDDDGETDRIVESQDTSSVELPPGWSTVKRNSASKKTKYETVLKSPEGKLFYSFLSALQFMTRNRKLHSEAQVEIMKRNLREEGWRQEEFLPAGWQLCEKQGTGGSRFRFLSDKMRYFESTSAVITFMRTNKYSQSQIDNFRSEMSSTENTKKVPIKQNKATPYKKVPTVCRSAKKILDKKKTQNKVPVPKLTEADIIIIDEAEKSPDENSKTSGGEGKWEKNSESLPPGWERRVRGATKMEFIKSPAGSVFKSRYAAVREMMKNKASSSSSVIEMKRKMVEYEGWEESQHLPTGWLVKVNYEGFTKDNKRYLNNMIYLTREGQSFTSMKGVQEYLSQSQDYSREEAERCWNFLNERNKLTIETRFDWRESDTVPPGWKVRWSGEGEGSKEYILSPDGLQYKTRFVALQDLATKSASQEDQDELRRKMVEHENWEESPLLPAGWLFKVMSEGTVGKEGRWSSKLCYLSREGVAFDSMKEVLAHLRLNLHSSPSLVQENIQNCQEFLKVRSQQTIELRYSWEESESLPPGWRMRRAEGQGRRQVEFFLSPHNTQYKSRFSAVQDMMVRSDLYTADEVELMKEKLISEESWEVSSLLPAGWLYKVVWEGESKNKVVQTNIWFLSSEGFYFESMKAAREYIKTAEGYQESDDERCQQFLDQQRQLKSKSRYNWEEGGETLPPGWCRRTAQGSAGMEFILSPQGEQFKSRFAALMWLYRSQADLSQIQELKEKLSFEGWQSSDLLPEGWLYRRAYERYRGQGSQISNTLYLSREGQCYDSVRTATEFLASCDGYYQQHQDNLRKLHKMLGAAFTKTRSDWVEDEVTLPRSWKRRKCGKVEFFLRPDGQQFKSRLSALQAMIREKYPSREISQMRSHLHHEGWLRHKLLPRHWFYKKSLTTWNKRKVMDYSFLSAEGPQFSSMRSAGQYLATQSYSTKQINNWQTFVRSEGKESLETSHDWSEASCLPEGWRTRVGGGEGRRYFLSPGADQFLSLLTAYQHLLSQGQSPASLQEARDSLASEGWQHSDHLPAQWLSKQTNTSTSYLDNKGNIYLTAKKALEAVEEDSSYSPEERSLVRKIVEAGEVSLDEKYNWKSYPELPEGWKVRRKVSRSRKMIDFYLAPDGKHIRGRTSAVHHLISLGGRHSEIAKMKNFSWFKIRKNRQSLDNTLEELQLVSEESDISLSSSFDSNASDMSGLFEDEKSSEVEQCQEYSGQDILDKIKHLQKLVKQGEQAEAQQTLLEIENSVTLKNKRTKR